MKSQFLSCKFKSRFKKYAVVLNIRAIVKISTFEQYNKTGSLESLNLFFFELHTKLGD